MENTTALVPKNSLRELPLLPLKNSVLFPGLLMPLGVGRAASIAAVDAALLTEEKEIVVVAQRDSSVDVPDGAQLYSVGTRAIIRKATHGRQDHVEVIALGVERVVLVKVEDGAYLKARIRPLALPDDSSREIEALTLSLIDTASKYINLSQPQSGGGSCPAF